MLDKKSPKTQWHIIRHTYGDVHGSAKSADQCWGSAGRLCIQREVGFKSVPLVFILGPVDRNLWKGFCIEMSLVQEGVPPASAYAISSNIFLPKASHMAKSYTTGIYSSHSQSRGSKSLLCNYSHYNT